MSPALEAQSLHHRTTREAQPPFFINLGLFKTKVKRDGLHTQSPFRLYVFNNYHIPGGAFILKYKDIVTGFKKKKKESPKEPCEMAFPYQYPSLQHLLPKTECTKYLWCDRDRTPKSPPAHQPVSAQRENVPSSPTHFLLQGILPNQGRNPCLLHRQTDSLPAEPPGKAPGARQWQSAHPQSLAAEPSRLLKGDLSP